jgi:tetratricopeptide (TPR) repeat protein
MAHSQAMKKKLESSDTRTSVRWRWACALVVLATLIVYWQGASHGFIEYDDPDYVSRNPRVMEGLSLHGLVWAFTTVEAANWHPLTWLVHMANWQLFGSWAGGHHLVSVALHTANTALLFVFLNRTTRAPGPSVFVAALFALHPLHVQSVAWVAETKDVLSAFFFMLSLLAYARYVERPGRGRYALVALLLALGLMAKPMLVTLPFVMLLLDHWPLKRSSVPWKKLCLEKVPLLFLVAGSCVVTVWAQKLSGAVQPLSNIPLSSRLASVVVAYVEYLGQMLWPVGLAVFYPRPATIPGWQVAGAVFLLAAITVATFRLARRYPFGLVGWLWYLGMLVPVIGLVQVGEQMIADRYTYLPLIGIWIGLAWAARALAEQRPRSDVWLRRIGVLTVVACAAVTWRQVGLWKDSIVLFEHALRVTKNNYIAHNNLGVVLRVQGKFSEAKAHFLEALRLRTGYPDAHCNLGLILAAEGDLDGAIKAFKFALKAKYQPADTHGYLALALLYRGDASEASAHLAKALAGDARNEEGLHQLGVALANRNRTEEAIQFYTKALNVRPDFAAAHKNLGIALTELGRHSEAIVHYEKALQLQPNDPETHNNLGVEFARHGQLEQATYHFRQALNLRPGYENAQRNLEQSLSKQ